MKSGIYRIICAASNKFYVGSSQNIERRLVYHFNRLRANKHPNIYLQSSYNLYGESMFLHEVIKYCPVESLLTEEQTIIDAYWNTGQLFNLAQIAGASFRNKRHSSQTKEKMKHSHAKPWLGKHLSNEHKEKIATMRMKLTRQRGLRKLTDEQVREIRRLKKRGLGDRKIAQMYGVSRKIVICIRTGARYADVKDE